MASHPENPPEKQKPPGKPTRYQEDIDNAKDNPGQWFRLEGEHHSGNIATLKGHGLAVRSRRGQAQHKHLLWICFQPAVDSEPAA